MSEQSHEFSAKSVEVAIQDGLRQLGVSRERVEIEVLHEGSRGLLGIGSTNARVRITVQELPEIPKKTEPKTDTPPSLTPPSLTPSSLPPSTSTTSVIKAAVEEFDTDDEDDQEVTPSPSSSPASMLEAEDDEIDAEAEDTEYRDRDASDSDLEEVTELASGMLLEMINLMGMDAQVESSLRNDPDDSDTVVNLNLIGDDLGALIGRQGETLSSLQYLVRLMVSQKLRRWTNIVVDVEGYKERRAERLAQMALRMADQVVETGKSVALEPMPGNERRLIHIALRDHPHVYTESIGEDTRRKIQILPK